MLVILPASTRNEASRCWLGAPGRTLVNGEEQPPKLTRQLRTGDVVRVETPGGGGYGESRSP